MNSERVFPIGPALPSHRSLVGGKAAGLGELCRAGAPVPDGVVLVLNADSPQPSAATRLAAEQLLELDANAFSRFAVRSSSVLEDGIDASYAGMFETFLNVSPANIWEAVAACVSATRSARVASYQEARAQGCGSNPLVPVIIQRMVPATVAGVAFSAHPFSSNPNHFTIEAAPGLGERVVSGQVTPDMYVIDVSTAEVIEFEAGDWAGAQVTRALSEACLCRLVALMIRMRSHLRYEIDLEFAFHDDQLFALQVRPITTLAA